MSRQTNFSFKQRTSFLALALCIVAASCSKESDLAGNAGTDETIARTAFDPAPGNSLCKPVTFNLNAVYPHVSVVSISEDSLFDFQYDNKGLLKSAKAYDYFKNIVRYTFTFDASKNLRYVYEYKGNSGTPWLYSKLTYPAGTTNSMSATLTVTGYTLQNNIYKEGVRTDYNFNAAGQLRKAQRYPLYSNSPFYYVYNNEGNLLYVSSGSIGGHKHSTYTSYDNKPNAFRQDRVWQLLSGNFSNNNPTTVTATWHDVDAQQLRRMDVVYTYSNNAFGQIDKVSVTNKYQQANGSFITETKPLKRIWKSSCDHSRTTP